MDCRKGDPVVFGLVTPQMWGECFQSTMRCFGLMVKRDLG